MDENKREFFSALGCNCDTLKEGQNEDLELVECDGHGESYGFENDRFIYTEVK